MESFNLGEMDETFNPDTITIDLTQWVAYDISCLVSSGDTLTIEFTHDGQTYYGLYEFFLDAPTYCDCCGPEFNSACLTRV